MNEEDFHKRYSQIPYEWDEEEKVAYRNLVEYMAKTELFDRSLPHAWSRYDETEAWVTEPWAVSQSGSYAIKLWREKIRCGSAYQRVSKRCLRYTAQQWVDEWERIKNDKSRSTQTQ